MQSIKNLYQTICNILKAFTFLLFVSLAGTGAIFVSGVYKPDPAVVETVKEVFIESPEPSFDELLKTIPPKYGLKPLEMLALIEAESGGRMSAVRFEPSKIEIGYAIAKKHGLAGAPDYQEQARAIASSHCAAQVMGYTAEEFNVWWDQLYNPRVCLEVSSAKLSKCLERYKTKKTLEKYEQGYACYNGSGPLAVAYGKARTRRLGELLIEQQL